MVAVEVRLEDFADQRLPHVCVATGGPAEHWYEARAERNAGGMWFLVIGLWAFLLPKTEVKGWLPMSEAAVARIKRNRRRASAVAAGGVLAAVAAFGFEQNLAALGMLAVSLCAVFLAVNPPGSIGATLQRDARWIKLDPVHPRFASAYRDGLAVGGHTGY